MGREGKSNKIYFEFVVEIVGIEFIVGNWVTFCLDK